MHGSAEREHGLLFTSLDGGFHPQEIGLGFMPEASKGLPTPA